MAWSKTQSSPGPPARHSLSPPLPRSSNRPSLHLDSGGFPLSWPGFLEYGVANGERRRRVSLAVSVLRTHQRTVTLAPLDASACRCGEGGPVVLPESVLIPAYDCWQLESLRCACHSIRFAFFFSFRLLSFHFFSSRLVDFFNLPTPLPHVVVEYRALDTN